MKIQWILTEHGRATNSAATLTTIKETEAPRGGYPWPVNSGGGIWGEGIKNGGRKLDELMIEKKYWKGATNRRSWKKETSG